jgi:hypothetical protein
MKIFTLGDGDFWFQTFQYRHQVIVNTVFHVIFQKDVHRKKDDVLEHGRPERR